MSAAMFPLLGIIFAFVVAANFAMSHGEDWFSSACLCSPR
jgi:hypothetical protein